MNKVEIGKYYKLPINGFIIYGFDFTQFIRIVFLDNQEDEWKYELEIWGNYRIKRYGKEFEFSPTEIEGFKILLDFSEEKIKTCKADKGGNLWIETDKGNNIEIEDGPYENWQFKIHKRMPRFKTKTHLIGGVGSTVMFEEK